MCPKKSVKRDLLEIKRDLLYMCFRYIQWARLLELVHHLWLLAQPLLILTVMRGCIMRVQFRA